MPAGSGTVEDQSEPVRAKQRGTRILVVSILVATAVLLTVFSAFVYYGSQDDDAEDATDDIVISDEVRLPEEDSSVVEVQVESDSITYIYDVLPEELNYSVGDVIVGTTDLGYLRRVTAIEQDGNTVTVQTENATLEDAIRNGTLAFTADLVDSSAQGLSCADLCKASILSDDYELFGIDIPVNETCYVGEVEVRLYGEVNLSISLSLEVDFDIFTGLHRVYFAVNTYTYFEFHFIASSEATFSEEWVAYSHWFPTYVVYVGSLPVTLTPQIEFIVNATGGMSSSLTAGVNGTVTTTLGMEYSGGFWSTVQDYTRDVEYEPPVLEGSASLHLNTSTPRLTLWVYGMVGPYVSLWPWASFDAEGQAGLDEISLSWNLDAGLKGKAGVRVEVLSVRLIDYSVDLFGYTWNIASGDVLLTAPSPPLSLVGIPGDGLVTLSWEPPLSDGGLAITEYRVLRGSSSGSGEFLASTGLSTMYADGDVVNDVAYYYVVTVRNGLWESETSEEVVVTPTSAPLPPSAPIGLVATQEGTSVSLTWEPPLSEGSSPITGYNLYRNGSVLAELDATTSHVDDAVVTGCTYTYQVSALNDVGESLLSNEVVIVVEEVVDVGIYAVGGRIDDLTYTGAIEYLGPNQTGEMTWSSYSSMDDARYGVCAAAHSGRVFVFGGGYAYSSEVLDRVDVYDPVTDIWTLGSPMPENRTFAAAVTVGDMIYVIGGWNGTAALNRTDVYDPRQDTWIVGPDMSYARSRLAAVAVGDAVYAIGGNSDGSTSLDVVECLDTYTMSWSPRQSLTEARNSLAVAAVNDLIYAVGGHQNPGTYLNLLSVYYPTLDRWFSLDPMPTSRSELAAVSCDGKVWAIGGQAGALSTTSVVEVFDPASSSWSQGPAMPTARCGLAGVVLSATPPPAESSFSEDFEAYSSVDDVEFEMVWTKHVVGYPSGADSAKIETLPSGNKVLWGSATNVPSKAFSQIYDARGVYAEDFVMEFDLANITFTGSGSYLVFVVGMDFRASENTCYRFAFVYSLEMGGAKEFLYKMPSGRQWENMTEVLAETSWHAYSLPDSHHVKVVCSGPEISAYLDSGPDPILSATDASFVGGFIGTYLEAGDGGIGQFTGSRHVDNITLDLMEVAVVQYYSDAESLEPAGRALSLLLEQPDCPVGLVDDSLASAPRRQSLKSDGCRDSWAARLD